MQNTISSAVNEDDETERATRPKARERRKEYMRLYRARGKNVTCYNQMIVAIVGTLTVIIRKYKSKRC
jgi:hypothetical protein